MLYETNENEEQVRPSNEELNQILEEVANATVELGDGQGVLVEGGFFITAAHCVQVDVGGRMAFSGAQGPDLIEEIRTTSGKKMMGVTIAVELVSDIAAVGPLDADYDPENCVAFMRFCDKTKSVKICQEEPEFGEPFRIHLRTHFHTWIKGTATLCVPNDRLLSLELEEQAVHGTSGGPVVNDAGELVGVFCHVVQMGKNKEELLPCSVSSIPRPHLALPGWLLQKILRDEG